MINKQFNHVVVNEIEEEIDVEDTDNTCPYCDGTGEGRNEYSSCSNCNGSGKNVKVDQDDWWSYLID